MAPALEREERFLSSRGSFELPPFCQPATEASFDWIPIEAPSPEQLIGDIVEDALSKMSPEAAGEAIEQAREILVAYKARRRPR